MDLQLTLSSLLLISICISFYKTIITPDDVIPCGDNITDLIRENDYLKMSVINLKMSIFKLGFNMTDTIDDCLTLFNLDYCLTL